VQLNTSETNNNDSKLGCKINTTNQETAELILSRRHRV
jgi:hypothetical protein